MFDRRVSCDDPSGTEVRISYTSFLFTGWGRRVDLVVRYKSKDWRGAIGDIGKAKSSMETSKYIQVMESMEHWNWSCPSIGSLQL